MYSNKCIDLLLIHVSFLLFYLCDPIGVILLKPEGQFPPSEGGRLDRAGVLDFVNRVETLILPVPKVETHFAGRNIAELRPGVKISNSKTDVNKE